VYIFHPFFPSLRSSVFGLQSSVFGEGWWGVVRNSGESGFRIGEVLEGPEIDNNHVLV